MEVKVLGLSMTDPTDTKTIARGKQKIGRGRLMYTPVSGIGKTVWLGPVGPTYITGILSEADVDNYKVCVV